jgi:hypothetical protein
MDKLILVRLDLSTSAKVALAVIVACLVVLVLLQLKKVADERRQAEQLAVADSIPMSVVGFTASHKS